MNELVLNVRQIMEYPLKGEASSADAVLLQTGALGGPYAWTTAYGLVTGALDWPGSQLGVGIPLPANAVDTGVLATNFLAPIGCNVGWNYYLTAAGPQLLSAGFAGRWCFGPTGSPNVASLSFQVSEDAVNWLDLFELDYPGILSIRETVVVGRDPVASNEVATKNYVDTSISSLDGDLTSYINGLVSGLQNLYDNFTVWSWNGRTGNVALALSDVTAVGGAPVNSPFFTGSPTVPTPPTGDNSSLIPTTYWVNQAIDDAITLFGDTQMVTSFNGRHDDVVLLLSDITGAGGAPLNSPSFSGTPSAPTPAYSDSSTRLATTAFVQHVVDDAVGGLAGELPTTFVTSWNSRTGHVTMTLGDVTGVGGAPIASPTFSGLPRAPTPPFNDRSDRIATTDFVWDGLDALEGELTGEIRRIVVVSNTPPANPRQGDLWWDSSKGRKGGTLYVWYVDATSQQWVVAVPQIPGPPGPEGVAFAHVGDFPPPDPRQGEFWWEVEEDVLRVRVEDEWRHANLLYPAQLSGAWDFTMTVQAVRWQTQEWFNVAWSFPCLINSAEPVFPLGNGSFWYNTTNRVLHVMRSGAWIFPVAAAWYSAGAPPSPVLGQLWWVADLEELRVFTEAGWRTA
jgi:hypothetical protein